MAPSTVGFSCRTRIGPQRADARRERQRDVLAHRALRQQRLEAVRRGRTRRPRGWRPPDGRSGPACRPRAARRHPDGGLPRAPRTAPPGPGPRAPRRPAPRPRGARRRRRGACVPARSDWMPRGDGPGPSVRCAAAGGARGRVRGLGGLRGAGGTRLAPSIRRTIRSSAPGAMSTTPTVSPSRSTVARSHRAEISMRRWEMKITERPLSRCRPTTSSTLSVRSAGSAAVISSSSSTSGSMASARARSMMRSTASGRSRAMVPRSRSGTPSSATQRRNAASGVAVRRRLSAMSRSGMSDGSW